MAGESLVIEWVTDLRVGGACAFLPGLGAQEDVCQLRFLDEFRLAVGQPSAEALPCRNHGRPLKARCFAKSGELRRFEDGGKVFSDLREGK